MRPFTKLCLFFALIGTSTNAQDRTFDVSSKMTDFEPKDVGALHTDAFQKLEASYGKRHPSEKNAKTRHNDLVKVVSSYCEDGDQGGVASKILCDAGTRWAKERITQHIQKSDLEAVQETGRFPLVEYPAEMHADLKDSLDTIFSHVDTIDRHNLSEVTDAIRDIETKVEAMDHVDIAHKRATLSAASVAIESSQLWHRVWHDPEHPLRISNDNKDDGDEHDGRNLQLVDYVEEEYDNFFMNLLSFNNMLNICNNGLVFSIMADVVGVFLTPISVFAGIPTAYVTYGLSIGVYIFAMINNSDTVQDVIEWLGFYLVLPFLIPFLMAGLPTTLSSFAAFSTLEQCRIVDVDDPSE